MISRASAGTWRRVEPQAGAQVEPQAGIQTFESSLAFLSSAVAELEVSLRGKGLPPSVETALDEFLNRGGKRVRPALCFLMGEILGVRSERLKTCARAAEWTHAASLIHDDVIDRSDLRRGKPALHSIVGETRSILAGDLLLARVMEDLLSAGGAAHALALSEAIRDLSAGEWLEVEARRDLSLTPARLEEIARLKTGALLRWCAQSAAREIQLSSRTLQAFGDFGTGLGLAFQISDDVLDFREGTGKPRAQDLREGVINFVTLELIATDSGAKARLRDFFAAGDPDRAGDLFSEEEIARASLRGVSRAEACFRKAIADLQEGCALAAKEGAQVNEALLRHPSLEALLAKIAGVSRVASA